MAINNVTFNKKNSYNLLDNYVQFKNNSMRKAKIYKRGELINNGIKYIEEVEMYRNKRKAKFLCHCGKEFITRISVINCGDTKSCGCLQKEKSRKMMIGNHRNYKHGDNRANVKQHYLYKTWSSIKQRCNNPKNKGYKYYGGRGITMHPEWIDDYPKFKKYILDNLGERPKGMSLDRINNDGNYEPHNLRWATLSQQNLNRRL